jgi:hypothetical protein
MLMPYSATSARRSVYSLLLGLAVLGPVIGVILSYTRIDPKWLEGVSYVAGLAGIAFLSIWCAIYVREEPLRVRVALIWVALLFLFVFGVLLTHTHVS